MNQDNSQKKNNINDSNVAPTDLRNTDIEMFGQENIPLMSMDRKAAITDFDLSSKNSEFNNIGTVPPNSYTEKEKNKKLNLKKFGFLSLIFIIIGLIGGGIYFYLSSSRKIAETAVITKTIEVSVGEKLSLNLSDYAEFNNIKATNCILNTENVDTTKIGKYTYVISCGVNDYKGTINIVDNKAPTVETKIVLKNIGEEIDVNEFIVSCTDASECSFTLKNFDELKEKMNAEGIYDAFIEVSDKNKNKIVILEKVVVYKEKANSVLHCNYNKIDLVEYKGYYSTDENVVFEKDYATNIFCKNTYYFENKKEYEKLKKEMDENNILEIEGVSGEAYFDDSNQTITLIDLRNVLDNDFFSNHYIDGVEEYYGLFGYTCELY